MIQVSESTRRVLTFPAVHPCESISPSTLLNSLLHLAQSICAYKSKFFSSNKRNAQETIRQVQNLTIFLEEIRLELLADHDGILLSLSELHLAFQKIQYLLGDCTLEGARLWMLMNSERVANQFRILVRAISTALDVLPLDAVDVSSEVKELVELAMRQARKARFEVDMDDKRVINDVNRMLGQFEDGVEPDRDEVKRVLDYLGVTKWSKCNKEVKFLETEIGLEYLNVEKRREPSLYSSLMGFLSYCRCVLFDHVDTEASQQVNKKLCTKMLTGVSQDDFRCPISLEIMKDPVTLSSGHTYDRASILKWFRAGNSTCPKTGEKLKSQKLVSNSVLKRIIQDWSVENGVSIAEESRTHHKNRDITRTVLAGSLAAEGALKMLAKFLADRLVEGRSEERNKAAYEMRILTKTRIFNRSSLVEAGTIPSLLNLLSSKDSLAQENAIAALLNLSKHQKSKSIIVENGGLEFIIDVLKKGLKVEARYHAAGTLFYLASVEKYRKLIGENSEAIPALVEMVRDGSDHGKKNALVTMFGLLTDPGNHWKVLTSGAVPTLVDLLTTTEREELVTDSLAVLATLAEKLEGILAIVSSGALNVIVNIFESTSRAGKEHCVSLLLALCINGGEIVVARLGKSPSLMGSLYSVISEGTSRASKKASNLIRLLHEFYERSSSGSIAPVLLQERSVHVW